MIVDMQVTKQQIKLSNPWHLLATGFGSGMVPWIPGTIGSLIAIPIWFLLTLLPWQFYLLVMVFNICIGVYFCHQIARDIGLFDPSCIIWDEFIGMWITMSTLPVNNWHWILMSFILFRLLDIWKPWPIYLFERKLHGGIGIVIDDVLAGVIAANILYLLEVITSYYF